MLQYIINNGLPAERQRVQQFSLFELGSTKCSQIGKLWHGFIHKAIVWISKTQDLEAQEVCNA